MGLTSSNPEEREAALRLLVRRRRDEASVSDTDIARLLGRTRQLWQKQLADDGEAYVRLSDLPILERLVPGIAGELLAEVGFRVVPASTSGTASDILAGLAQTMGAMGALTSETTGALPDGIDGREAHEIRRAGEALIKAAGALLEGVDAAVVTPRRPR